MCRFEGGTVRRWRGDPFFVAICQGPRSRPVVAGWAESKTEHTTRPGDNGAVKDERINGC